MGTRYGRSSETRTATFSRSVSSPDERTPSDHTARNREAWDGFAEEYFAPGREAWASDEPFWGIWQVPEMQVGVLPEKLERRDAVELGCGAGYVSAWLARRGARPVGVDLSTNQPASAAKFQREFGLDFPLVQADAETVPFGPSPSIWSSVSTGPASGAILIGGSRRRPECCAPAAS